MSAPARSVGVAVAQFAPVADTAANVDAIARLTAEAVRRGARLVVFPEYASYFVDPFDPTLAEHAQALDGPFVRALTDLAAQHDVHLVAGLVERAGDERHVHNTAVAVGASGLLARYRKLHLYDAFGQRESDWVAPGAVEEPQTFEVDGLTVGLMTCYDLRFPEVARLLADAGADLVAVPAEWVRGPLKEHHWRTLLHARAIENTLFVAAADHPPPLGVGSSLIVDPQGVEVAAIGTGTDVAVAHLDADAVERVRRVNPALRLRRFTVVERPS
ncbi:putative amidohydrolase [Microbacterium terrae]|uniref:2-oxoglutaramate amidase n=1 Tax=Microbacterium terrae TaxID=69369 RepID=A0A0M2HG91_9MICO|nr:carbon-nitrogen hydrolase family protein [Microbacterium terrae]KJL43704.1 2-oxoglutaramate amidase [Microbacterium terrae]KJL43761.1 2-oxoglutaramate amidase [Microbacterium terrae]MBP1077008.1 putative amidohydrolase [Microbacterium terrae]GLJ99601.1 hydrolase [Microbacterium terrae]